MDLFKNVKELKAYTNSLAELCDDIAIHDTKLKIGKFKIIQTPSEFAARRLHEKIHTAVHEELQEITTVCNKIEAALEEIQIDLFKTDEGKTEKNTLKFGSKVQ